MSRPDPSDSLIDRLHPRTRLVATFVFIFFFTTVHHPIVLGAALAGAGVLVRLARRSWADLWHRLAHIEGFLLAVLVLLPFTVPGETLFSLGPIKATVAGVNATLMTVLRINVCVLTVFGLLGSLDPVRIGQAAESLGVPSKFANLFLFSARYVPVFRAETLRLSDAMRARAFRPHANAHSWRTYGNLAGVLLLRSLERARRVDEAMRCRGFTGRLPAPPQAAAGRHDLAFATVIAGAMAGLLLMEHAL